MYLDIEKRSEEFAAAVLSVDENARGPIATAFVCGANEMLEAIEKTSPHSSVSFSCLWLIAFLTVSCWDTSCMSS